MPPPRQGWVGRSVGDVGDREGEDASGTAKQGGTSLGTVPPAKAPSSVAACQVAARG